METTIGLIGPGRRYANLIASCWPLARTPVTDFQIPYPEKVVSAVIAAPTVALEVHNAHLPPGSTRPLHKLATFEGIFERLAQPARRPRILCGDFNTPRLEHSDGTVETWAGRRPALAKRWEEAERAVLVGLRDFDLTDAYRALHGYDTHPTSYLPGDRDARGRRYDHIYVSNDAKPSACGYHQDWLRDRLSDHAAVYVELDLANEPPSRAERLAEAAKAAAG
jgi:endonuclease/exonuclease/phosphatase family metal-dependent hydrolase